MARKGSFSRRAVLGRVARASLSLVGTALLAACGATAATTTASTSASGTAPPTSAASSTASAARAATNSSAASATSSAALSPASSATTSATLAASAATSSVATSSGAISSASSSSGAIASSAVAKGATKVTVLTHWDPATTLKAFEPYVTEYQQAHPGVTVDVSAVDFSQLLQKITVAHASGSVYDIYHIYDLWLAELVKGQVLAAAPQDTDGLIKGAYPPGAVDAVSSQGHVYGFPTEIDTYALNYNQRLFQEAGVSEPPKTWADLEAAAHKLTKVDASGAITQQGFGLITGWDSGVVHPWLSMLWSDGGEFLAPDFKHSTFNSAQGQETLDFSKRLIDSKVTDPAMAKGYSANFYQAKTAMIIMANWWQSTLQAKMKDAFADIKTAPIPVGPSGSTSVALDYAWLFALDSASKEQPAAWSFLEWLNGPATAGKSSRMGDWLLAQGILPSRNSDRSAHQAELNTPFLKTYVDALQTARPFPIVLGGAEITTDLQKQIETVILSGAAPKAALTTAQTQIDALLQKYYG